MIHLGIDPGAVRLGFGIVSGDDGEWELHDSGVDGVEREEGEGFQPYRKRLIDHWAVEFGKALDHMIEQVGVDQIMVTFEALPGQSGSKGFSGGGAVQGELAKTAAAACQALCADRGVRWRVVGATTVKKDVTGNGKATKVGVRNAIIKVFPQLEDRKKELTGKGADESDGIAIGLWSAGYRFRAPKQPRRKQKK